MKIILTECNNQPLRGDLVPFVIKRTDLTPIPSTVECLIRVNEEIAPYLKEGSRIAVADPSIQYRIVFVQRSADGYNVQGNPNYTLTKIIAILESCHKLSYLAEKAIIKEKVSIAELFRACGAEIAIKNDIAVDKFSCLVGQYPTFSLMRAIGRTACAVVWDGKNTLECVRLRDIFNRPVAEVMPVDITTDFSSSFIERHETPSYYSNSANGSIAKNNAKGGRRAEYEAFADSATLNNLSTYLVNRKVWTTPFTPNLNAGDIVKIADEKFVIITACHAFSLAESGSGSQLSRFWLGNLSKALAG